MDNFELHDEAQRLADCNSSYQLARMYLTAARAQGDGEAAAEVRLNEAGDAASMHWLRPFSSFDVGQKFYSDQPAQQVPEYVRLAMNEAFDIIVADANTEENYSAVRRIENALGWLNTGVATPQPEAGEQWVRCEDRLPTEVDEDFEGRVWLCWPYRDFVQRVTRRTTSFFDGFWWMPTGLTRPQPPKEQGE